MLLALTKVRFCELLLDVLLDFDVNAPLRAPHGQAAKRDARCLRRRARAERLEEAGK